MPVEQTSSAETVLGGAPGGVKADFAERLKSAMERKGWSLSEAARQVSRQLGEGEKFGRAHMWHYLQGRALPRSRYLWALSRALEVEPGELLPDRTGPLDDPAPAQPIALSPGDAWSPRADMVHVRDYGDGTALLEISHRIPWDTALKVVQVLKTRSE